MSANSPISGAAAGTKLTEYRAEITALGDTNALAQEWHALETVGAGSFFTDWLWIGTWLTTADPQALVARVEHNDQLVAIGLFVVRDERRHFAFPARVARLQQTGQDHDDQIWIEYNGLVALPEHAHAALNTAVATLLKDGQCQEVQLSMLPGDSAASLELTRPRARRLLEQAGFYHRNDQNADPIDALSSNTRAQIRRSLRLYEKQHGRLRIEAATSIDQALAFFNEAGQWHTTRWPDSGFKNPSFTRFHETLIKRGFDHGRTQLFRVAFGDYVMGVFYFLLKGQHAYFYLQGVRAEANGKLKPGLTGHSVLMRHFFKNGVTVYDFMGGDSQYKRQLANGENAFVSLSIDNGAWRFRVEHTLRRIKQRLLRT